MTGGQPDAAMSRHIAPLIHDRDERTDVIHLLAAYPDDFRDIATALVTRYSVGSLSFETVDATLRANGFDWPNGRVDRV